MKSTIFAFMLFIAFNSYAGLVPRVNCVGSSYDKKLLNEQEVEEEKVLLEFRNGGAAFSDTFIGELKDLTFIVVINKMLPLSNIEPAPLNLGIYNAKTNKTLAQKNVFLLANGLVAKVDFKDADGKILTLSCSRLLNP